MKILAVISKVLLIGYHTLQDEQDPGMMEGIVNAGLGAAAGLRNGAVQPLDKVLGGASNGGKTLSIS